MKNTAHIEPYQGIDGAGRLFGYDHRRHNFFTWGHNGKRVVVHSVEHDTEAQGRPCGSLAATRRDAQRVAAMINSDEYNGFAREIEMTEMTR